MVRIDFNDGVIDSYKWMLVKWAPKTSQVTHLRISKSKQNGISKVFFKEIQKTKDFCYIVWLRGICRNENVSGAFKVFHLTCCVFLQNSKTTNEILWYYYYGIPTLNYIFLGKFRHQNFARIDTDAAILISWKPMKFNENNLRQNHEFG